jgi:DNA-binding NarL/FixJ family response regulator
VSSSKSYEPAWTRFKDAVLEFTGRPPSAGADDPLLATLSIREKHILRAVVAGHNNAEIGAALFVSEKTVRNSLTRIFEKLGVRTRTQAAVLASDQDRRPIVQTHTQIYSFWPGTWPRPQH